MALILGINCIKLRTAAIVNGGKFTNTFYGAASIILKIFIYRAINHE